MRRDHRFRSERNAEPIDGRQQPEILEIRNHGSRNGDVEPLAVFLKLPFVRGVVARLKLSASATATNARSWPKSPAESRVSLVLIADCLADLPGCQAHGYQSARFGELQSLRHSVAVAILLLKESSMDTDICALTALAQTYFDAAHEMNAEKFGSIFHPSSAVTRVGDDGTVSVTPIETWLAGFARMQSPKLQGLERRDEIQSVDIVRELALVKLKLQIPPRYFTDMLSCLRVAGTWKIDQKVMVVETR